MYDIYSPTSIEAFAKKLIGKSFYDFLPNEFKNYKGKGGLGQLVEKYYFGYKPNSDRDPDFKEAGVELKVTPYKKIKKTKKNGIPFSSKERLVLSIINFEEIVNEDFFTSSFLHKNNLLLLIFYLHDFDIKDKLNFIMNYAQLFEYPEEDLQIIKQDWEKIVNKIRAGKAHELSEGDTMYLGACTKGSKKKDSYRVQPYCDIKAPQRAFSLKSSYMTHILRNYIIQNKPTYEPIIKDVSILEKQSFEDYVISQLSKYKGQDLDSLLDKFNVRRTSKDRAAQVALKILDVNSENASEFEKANIKVKTIRIENNGTIEQNMSFKNFKFKEIIKERWETSTFRTMLEETKFFFVIYKFDENNTLRLHGGLFWNIPLSDLDGEVKKVWKNTVNTIKEGVEIQHKKGKIYNNLPKKSQSNICHVRPKGSNRENCYELPDGRKLTKQCFWLNNTYILKQIVKHQDNKG